MEEKKYVHVVGSNKHRKLYHNLQRLLEPTTYNTNHLVYDFALYINKCRWHTYNFVDSITQYIWQLQCSTTDILFAVA